uniref:Nop domain-containing protein n=1 Tax=Lactuca sativa TaxID=4236 RepID=A0A9R1VUE4_LACSA|nr:hypothetical protein LSAT_V11C400211180 [Lactuca sativa]
MLSLETQALHLTNIKDLYDQALSLLEYRAQLYNYLKSIMNIIAPNLTSLVGEVVGGRLITHGGSLLNFAKQPGIIVQILGAEKYLFRDLETKHATPKVNAIQLKETVKENASTTKRAFQDRQYQVPNSLISSCLYCAIGSEGTILLNDLEASNDEFFSRKR